MDDDGHADGDDDENDNDDRKDVVAGDRPHPLLPSPVAGQCPHIPGNGHHGLVAVSPRIVKLCGMKTFGPRPWS